MELPKNITQIGEVGRDCKIYVEDYVVSYMKQLNRSAQDKSIAVALYGKRKEENGIVYYFIYGASKLDFLQREVRHLSQAQRQEMEQYRKRYFSELGLVGYRLLDGDMIEGFHICEQDICRYISGYAQFYEKNDAMLAYMLDVRETVKPEKVDQEKYDEVKKRQDDRRAAEAAKEAHVKDGVTKTREGNNRGVRTGREQTRRRTDIRNLGTGVNLQKMRLTAVGVFALLCLLGIATFQDDEIKNSANDKNAGVAVNSGSVQTDKLVMEDKLEQALLKENQSMQENQTLQESQPIKESQSSQDSQAVQESKTQPDSAPDDKDKDTAPTKESAEAAEIKTQTEKTQDEPVSSGAVAYVIQSGDTLIAISKRQYGTDIRVADICNLNKINDPDDIKEGQVIMLPR